MGIQRIGRVRAAGCFKIRKQHDIAMGCPRVYYILGPTHVVCSVVEAGQLMLIETIVFNQDAILTILCGVDASAKAFIRYMKS
jgi:hypothetical protein